MANKIQWRRDTAANWTAVNPVLSDGMPGYEKDTCRLKIGDGITPWNSLTYKFESSVVEAPTGTFTFTDEQGNTTSWTEGSAGGVTDHGSLTGLSDDDHLQYLNEARHDSLPQDNPHGVNATDVGLGNVDNTSDIDKPVSSAQQAALDLKYDASNPNSYETQSQLDVRDTDNRNRSNHTGTQIASTISDFSNQVKIDETTTSISVSGNNISYTDEDSVITNIPYKHPAHGWASFSSTNSQSISFNVRTKIFLSPGLSILNPFGPTGSGSWYDTTTETFKPDSSGDFYVLRFEADFTANQSDKEFLIELDIGGTQGVIWSNNVRTPKSGGNTKRYSFSIPVFTLGTFVANGGSFYVTYNTSGIVANPQLLVAKVFKS